MKGEFPTLWSSTGFWFRMSFTSCLIFFIAKALRWGSEGKVLDRGFTCGNRASLETLGKRRTVRVRQRDQKDSGTCGLELFRS